MFKSILLLSAFMALSSTTPISDDKYDIRVDLYGIPYGHNRCDALFTLTGLTTKGERVPLIREKITLSINVAPFRTITIPDPHDLVAVSAKWQPVDVGQKGCRLYAVKRTDGGALAQMSIHRVYVAKPGQADPASKPVVRFEENRVGYVPYLPPYEETYLSRSELTD